MAAFRCSLGDPRVGNAAFESQGVQADGVLRAERRDHVLRETVTKSTSKRLSSNFSLRVKRRRSLPIGWEARD